ncbi:hypothetical protein QLL95_gp0170 [Cotonvirus japonicus]|uniref:Uncharacterized protein n=1 Tax=Cotonvirus japonicus TaxID=2811091 RepID=A0ABM7NR74_9VIRU|nr:hypothetical protein QLL95_gp0170 [Cotonvirus japonicus]BCS82659.1 hypothetical protein [Cotonvirus japonicus]
MRKCAPQRFYRPGIHYTLKPLIGYKIFRIIRNIESFDFSQVDEFGFATVEIPPLTRIVTLDVDIGRIRTPKIIVKQVEDLYENIIIDDRKTCCHPNYPFYSQYYKAGMVITSNSLNTNINVRDICSDEQGIHVTLLNKQDLIDDANKYLSAL